MNEHVLWRLDLARAVSAAYTADSRVDSVLVAGSTARGDADQFSDIEINVFWSIPPSDEDRLAAMRRAGGHFHEYEEEEWSEVYTVHGVKLEISQFLSSTIERYICDVTQQGDPNVDKQVLLSSVLYGLPLQGEDRLRNWKTLISAYPDILAINTVKRFLDLDALWYYEPLAHRQDWLMLNGIFVAAIRNMVGVMHGLNRIYIPHPRFKWMDHSLQQMRIAPVSLSSRLPEAFRLPPARGIESLQAVAMELYDLVERHMPEVQFERPRKRETWSKRPQGL